jgi:neuroblastoma-amplified sequence
MTRPGMPITPLEIRLTKDRLSLVSRVLSSTSDAYKHPEVILELVQKLGLRDDPVAKVKALAMIADTALQSEDFVRAYEINQKMVETVQLLKYRNTAPVQVQQDASEVCWVACFQLGRQPEFDDPTKKLTLLSYTLEFCPAEKITEILSAWRRLEKETLALRAEKLAQHPRGLYGIMAQDRKKRRLDQTGKNTKVSSLADRLKDFAMPLPSSPDPSAIAHTFSRVAANFPFSRGGLGDGVKRPQSVTSLRSEESTEGRERSVERGRWGVSRDPEHVREQASRALQKGIGWLIGADDE